MQLNTFGTTWACLYIPTLIFFSECINLQRYYLFSDRWLHVDWCNWFNQSCMDGRNRNSGWFQLLVHIPSCAKQAKSIHKETLGVQMGTDFWQLWKALHMWSIGSHVTAVHKISMIFPYIFDNAANVFWWRKRFDAYNKCPLRLTTAYCPPSRSQLKKCRIVLCTT